MVEYTSADYKGETNVTIPSGYTSIGSSAFRSATKLETVTFEANSQLTSIGEKAFFNTPSLTSIIIPSKVTSIGTSAFYVTGLTSITIPEGVTSIGNFAFSNATSLTSISIPSTVTSIGDYAFFDSGLNTVYLPSSNGLNKTSPSSTSVDFFGATVTTELPLTAEEIAAAAAAAASSSTDLLPKRNTCHY
jgi:hypothetical protein